VVHSALLDSLNRFQGVLLLREERGGKKGRSEKGGIKKEKRSGKAKKKRKGKRRAP